MKLEIKLCFGENNSKEIILNENECKELYLKLKMLEGFLVPQTIPTYPTNPVPYSPTFPIFSYPLISI